MNETDQSSLVIRARGIQRVWDPRVWGTFIGAAGATVFVTAYRGALPAPWPVVSIIVWAVTLLAYLIAVFVIPRTFPKPSRVSARSGFIYLGSVVAMLLVIRLGTSLLENTGHTELRSALIVAAVGLHFLPFVAAFHTPMFTSLGVSMAVLGAIGLLLGWFWDPRAAGALAVISGIVMLGIIAADAVRTFQKPPPRPIG